MLGENWLFSPEPLGLTLDFWQGGCVSESKPEPDSAVGHSPPLHMADLTQLRALMALCCTGTSKPTSGFSSQGSSPTFPASEPQFCLLYVTSLLALGEGNNIIKKTTSNNPKVSNAVPGTFCLAQQRRRQLSPAVPTSSALWASQHFLPLSSSFVFGVLFQFLSLWLMLPKRQETSLVSLKCLLKIGAHPRGGFQSPCKCLKPHTIVFCGRGWLQLALGTGFPSSDREVLGIKHSIFILLLCLLCDCGEVTR